MPRSQRREDASGVLLAGLSVGLIFIAILLALVDRWAPGVFVTDERVELVIVGCCSAAGWPCSVTIGIHGAAGVDPSSGDHP